LAHSLAHESQKDSSLAPSTSPQAEPPDADLACLLALWPCLPQAGRRLLITTAQTLAGELPKPKRGPTR
jgi:hypothetical protein